MFPIRNSDQPCRKSWRSRSFVGRSLHCLARTVLAGPRVLPDSVWPYRRRGYSPFLFSSHSFASRLTLARVERSRYSLLACRSRSPLGRRVHGSLWAAHISFVWHSHAVARATRMLRDASLIVCVDRYSSRCRSGLRGHDPIRLQWQLRPRRALSFTAEAFSAST